MNMHCPCGYRPESHAMSAFSMYVVAGQGHMNMTSAPTAKWSSTSRLVARESYARLSSPSALRAFLTRYICQFHPDFCDTVDCRSLATQKFTWAPFKSTIFTSNSFVVLVGSVLQDFCNLRSTLVSPVHSSMVKLNCQQFFGSQPSHENSLSSVL